MIKDMSEECMMSSVATACAPTTEYVEIFLLQQSDCLHAMFCHNSHYPNEKKIGHFKVLDLRQHFMHAYIYGAVHFIVW